MNKIGDLVKLKSLLDEQMEFPNTYTFKFIVEKDELDELLTRLDGSQTKSRESKNGKYISITSIKKVQNSDEIIDVYQRVSDIKSIFSL